MRRPPGAVLKFLSTPRPDLTTTPQQRAVLHLLAGGHCSSLNGVNASKRHARMHAAEDGDAHRIECVILESPVGPRCHALRQAIFWQLGDVVPWWEPQLIQHSILSCELIAH